MNTNMESFLTDIYDTMLDNNLLVFLRTEFKVLRH